MIVPVPGYSFISTGNCPHLGVVFPARPHCSLGEILAPCHKDIVSQSYPSLIAKWLQKRLAQSRGQQVQNGDREAKLFSCF
jgi:hypothetical protein